MTPSRDDSKPLCEPAPVGRGEWTIVLALLLSGTIVRCAYSNNMAVEHFDEGVYASNLFCPGSDYAYPYRHLYAPALLPGLLEFMLILSGQAAQSVMWANVAAGCLIVPSVWWVGRSWLGPFAGLVAATLAATSEVHILYSRTAMTDGLLCLWMLWGVYWAWRTIHTGRPAAFLLAGLFAALAWWTKYSGWLTLAVSGAGMAAWLMAAKPPRRGVMILRWGGIALLAILGWLPFLLDLQSHGGYAVVADNHARYLVGWSGWGAGAQRQWSNLNFVESVSGSVVTVVMLLVSWWGWNKMQPAGQTDHRSSKTLVVWLLVLASAAGIVLVGSSAPLLLLSGIGIGSALWHNADRIESEDRLAIWMLSAWIVGLSVAVPLYHPYLRLTLPWVVATWLGTGLALQRLTCRSSAVGRPTESSLGSPGATTWRLIWGGILVIAPVGMLIEGPSHAAWEERRSLQRIAAEIHDALPPSGPQVVYVLGEPGLFYHLAAQFKASDRLILPEGDFASLSPLEPSAEGVSQYVVYGPHVMRTPADPSAGVSWAEASFSLLDEWAYLPSKLVLLNEHSPRTLQDGDQEPFVVRLGRIGE